jgi:hypothetical protein
MRKLIMVTQGMMKTQIVQFWYGILNKELRHWLWDAMIFQLAQPTMGNVFQLLECIEMKMMEEWVVTFGFNKENPRNAFTLMVQQFHGQLNKATPQKTKGAKLEQGGFTSFC